MSTRNDGEQAERGLLRCIIDSPSSLFAATETVKRDHFSNHRLALVYDACLRLLDDGVFVNRTTVSSILSENVDDLIGTAGETEGDWSSYAYVMNDRSVRRQCSDVGEAIIRASSNMQLDSNRLIDFSENAAFSIRDMSTANPGDHAASLATSHRASILSGEKWTKRIMYPWRGLNDASGGMGAGELIVIGGYSSDGKSVMGLMMMLEACVSGHKAGYWSLEMPSSQVQNRLISMGNVPLASIRDMKLTEDQLSRAMNRLDFLEKLDYTIYAGSTTVEEIRSRQVRDRYDVIIVDHLHRMDTDRKKLEQNIRSLKNLAIDTDAVVIVLAQLSRREGFPKPTTDQLRESAAVEFEADTVLLLWRERDESGYRTNKSKIVVGKMRDGETDYEINVDFRPSTMSFEDHGYYVAREEVKA